MQYIIHYFTDLLLLTFQYIVSKAGCSLAVLASNMDSARTEPLLGVSWHIRYYYNIGRSKTCCQLFRYFDNSWLIHIVFTFSLIILFVVVYCVKVPNVRLHNIEGYSSCEEKDTKQSFLGLIEELDE